MKSGRTRSGRIVGRPESPYGDSLMPCGNRFRYSPCERENAASPSARRPEPCPPARGPAGERGASVGRPARGEVGLHQNTIRAHLAVLEDADLVVVRSERDGRPGRPRRLFAAVPEEAEAEHALLASALASSLEPRPDGVEIATAAGRSWGTVLVERLEPGRPADEDSCVERVASLLRKRGFAPEREQIRCRHAPLPVPRARRALPTGRIWVPCGPYRRCARRDRCARAARGSWSRGRRPRVVSPGSRRADEKP